MATDTVILFSYDTGEIIGGITEKLQKAKINDKRHTRNDRILAIKQENETLIMKRDNAVNFRKYLDSKISGENSWLVTQLTEICQDKGQDLAMCSFRFENSIEAAEWNADVLTSYNNDFEKAIANNKKTIVAPGSEFRKLATIKELWQFRENWTEIEEILTKGCIYPLISP